MVSKNIPPKRCIVPIWNTFYTVTSGERKGIYTDYNEALEAAWLSDSLVTVHGTKAKAELEFKKLQKSGKV